MKTFSFLIFFILLGFFLGRMNSKRGITSSSELQKIRKTSQEFYEKELKNYVSLKQQQQKFEKADEILGKVMLLFLADIGIHLKLEDQKIVEAFIRHSSRPQEKKKLPPASLIKEELSPLVVESLSTSTFSPSTESSLSSNSITSLSTQSKNSSLSKQEEFLPLEDPDAVIKKIKLIRKNKRHWFEKHIEGSFQGLVKIDSQRWENALMENDYRLSENQEMILIHSFTFTPGKKEKIRKVSQAKNDLFYYYGKDPVNYFYAFNSYTFFHFRPRRSKLKGHIYQGRNGRNFKLVGRFDLKRIK